MTANRKQYAAQNAMAATLGNVINSVLAFATRTIFIYSLGTVYNGINGLYTNILGMLSLAELGVGAAISFSLYKPLAEKEIKKIQAIMNFYRIAYRLIAGLIFVIGVCLIPFLKYIINGAEGVDHLILYYVVFLFDTVTSYLLIYKTTLVEADQRSYLITYINTVIKVIISIAQIIVLLIFKSFLVYLLIGVIVQLIGNIYICYFCNKEYPYLKEKNNEKLTKQELNIILTKIKALMVHKIGDKFVNQTDNIIISYFINVTVVGMIANYTMIVRVINTFIVSIFHSSTAAIGNIIATDNDEHKYNVALRYDFLGHIFYGWSSLCLYFLLTPFVTIWIGKEKLIDNNICFLLCLNYYLNGIRTPFNNVKGAAGLYEQDRWVPLLQAIINVVVSIVAVKSYGLLGVYIGTLVSSLIPLFIRPFVVYKYIFKENVIPYFKEVFYRLLQMAICLEILSYVFSILSVSNMVFALGIRFLLCTIVMCIIVIIFYRKRDEFMYVEGLISNYLKKNHS